VPYLPGPVVRRLRAVVRAALGHPRPTVVPPDEVRLLLDGILREMRRLHARLEELHEARQAAPGSPLSPRPWEQRRESA